MHTTYLVAAGVVGAIFFLLRHLLSPLRQIPGPVFARFTKTWYFLQISRGDFHDTNIELHRKYGKIVRIAPNQYSIDDPEAIKIIYALGSPFPKADWCKSFFFSRLLSDAHSSPPRLAC